MGEQIENHRKAARRTSVILYKTGVGYFEHLGNVWDRQNVTVRFTSAQLNDVLKSLTVLDLGKDEVAAAAHQLSKAREELSALIAKVSFEVAVPPPGRLIRTGRRWADRRGPGDRGRRSPGCGRRSGT